MVISTRTPEGDPVKCRVCGHEHWVLVSTPPGDSVCPSCGFHVWLAKTEELFPTQEVLRIVPAFVDRIRLSESPSEVAMHLVNGLFECLSPHGVTLWLPKPTASENPMHFASVASKGEVHSEEFAVSVADRRDTIMQVGKTGSRERLFIGVPLLSGDVVSVAGVIDVVQPTGASPDTCDGILRFIRTMAAVSSGSRAFS